MTKDNKEKTTNSIKEYLKTPPKQRESETGFVKFNRKDRTTTPVKRKKSTNKD